MFGCILNLGHSYLQDNRLTLVTDGDEVSRIVDSLVIRGSYARNFADKATGALVIVSDGDYDEVWLTISSRPFDLHANYLRVR